MRKQTHSVGTEREDTPEGTKRKITVALMCYHLVGWEVGAGKEGNKNEFTQFAVKASSSSERVREKLIKIEAASRKEAREAG